MTPPTTIASLGERDLIARLVQRLKPAAAHVSIGIGDDAAVIENERGMRTVVTTDALVEGVHFRRDWTSMHAIGHKALAVNLSDLAAMGAEPRSALLSLVLPGDLTVSDFDDLIAGLASLAEQTGTSLVGGNMARSPGPVVIDVTAMGVVRPRAVLTRRGARPGDKLFVTGTVGGAAAGLEMLAAGVNRESLPDAERLCIDRLERPDARCRLGRIVGRTRAAVAAIDLSDGLADAASRLAEGDRLGVVIDAALVPVHEGARAWWTRRGMDAALSAVTGGEDYELAFAVRPRQRRRFLAAAERCKGLGVTEVGEFVRERGSWLNTGTAKVPIGPGFTHF